MTGIDKKQNELAKTENGEENGEENGDIMCCEVCDKIDMLDKEATYMGWSEDKTIYRCCKCSRDFCEDCESVVSMIYCLNCKNFFCGDCNDHTDLDSENPQCNECIQED